MNEVELAARKQRIDDCGKDDLGSYLGHDGHRDARGRYLTAKFWKGSSNPLSYGKHIFEVTVPLEALPD